MGYQTLYQRFVADFDLVRHKKGVVCGQRQPIVVVRACLRQIANGHDRSLIFDGGQEGFRDRRLDCFAGCIP